MPVAAVALVVLAVTTGTVLADAAADARAFQQRLLDALHSGSRSRVASLFAYPLRVSVPGVPLPVVIGDGKALASLYDTVFTPELLCAIEHTALTSADGVASLAGGRIVAVRQGAGLKVNRLTSVGQPVWPRKPQQVTFRWGSGETQFSGTLSAGHVDSYVVDARAGTLLQARIERFPGRSLALTVTDVATGQRLQGSASEYARTWAARMPKDGAYRVDVLHKGSFCDRPVNYVLTVGVQL